VQMLLYGGPVIRNFRSTSSIGKKCSIFPLFRIHIIIAIRFVPVIDIPTTSVILFLKVQSLFQDPSLLGLRDETLVLDTECPWLPLLRAIYVFVLECFSWHGWLTNGMVDSKATNSIVACHRVRRCFNIFQMLKVGCCF
jgi:hypothetical protein